MCRWGCAGLSSTFMCKWCGTRYCKECLKGEFHGLMREATHCAKCNQKNCQGTKVEGILKQYITDENAKGGKSGTGSSRSRSASPTKRSASGSKKSGGKSGGKKAGKSGGKKGGKKKKKK